MVFIRTFGGVQGLVPIAAHHVVAADAELAGLADGHRAAGLRVHHSDLDVFTREAHRTRALFHRVLWQR